MTSRLVRIQLITFVVVTVLAVGLMAIQYVRLPQIVGIGQYTITLQLPETGGLYPQSNVTMRGHKIGVVRSISLGPEGMVATLSIDDDVRVPQGATASILSMSAIGEQYVDFKAAASADERYLAKGAVVRRERVSVPISTARLIGSTTALLESVPRDALRTTVTELATAFDGRGDDVGRLLDSASLLQQEADRARTETMQLIENLRPVLTTQDEVGDAVASAVADLEPFTRTVAENDRDLRRVLDTVPGFTREFSGFSDDMRSTLTPLLTSLGQAGEVLNVYTASIAHVLQIMPAIVESHFSTLTPESATNDYATLNLAFKLGVNDPPFCTTGYVEKDLHRDPSDLSPGQLPETSYCKVAPDDPRVVRGARNNPCPGLPGRRSADAAGCGFDFGDD